MRRDSPQRDKAKLSAASAKEADALGLAARDARRSLGLSQDEVAFAAHVSPRTVFAVEKGKATVRLDMLTRVLGAVGLTLEAVPRDRVWRPGASR
ncbi:MAG TPA: helix-turn-helix domain-containing protein [Solirubrobacterales bacterium]